MNAFPFVVGWALSLVSAAAIACSCGPSEIAADFEQATDVVIARVASTTQESLAGETSGNYLVEYASFDVIETLKGSKRVADKIQTRSEVGRGTCGRSARNSPIWVEVAPSPPSEDDRPQAATISDTWLIYGYGKEPYELSRCSRSRPIEMVEEKELETLREFAGKVKNGHKP